MGLTTPSPPFWTMLKTAGLVKRYLPIRDSLSLFWKMSKGEIDRVLQGGKSSGILVGGAGSQFAFLSELMRRWNVKRSCAQNNVVHNVVQDPYSAQNNVFYQKKNTTRNGKKTKSTVLLLLMRIFLFPFPLPFLGHFLFPSSIEHILFPCKRFFDCQAV